MLVAPAFLYCSLPFNTQNNFPDIFNFSFIVEDLLKDADVATLLMSVGSGGGGGGGGAAAASGDAAAAAAPEPEPEPEEEEDEDMGFSLFD